MADAQGRCYAGCFQYDEDNRACSYTQMDFVGTEPVEPGQRCLHPEFKENSLVRMTVRGFCAALDADVDVQTSKSSL